MIDKPRQHQRIHASLKKQLTEGIYPRGSLLPSENELASQFNTTRMTVRQALTELVREGYIERQPGKGSVVRSERQALGLLSFQGFSDAAGRQHTVRNQLLTDPAIRPWPDVFFYELTDAEKNLDCLTMNRIRYVDNNPVMLEYTWIPNCGLDALLTQDLLEGSLFRTLSSRYNLDIRQMDQRLRAVGATTEQAIYFACPRHTPLLFVERRYQTNQVNLHLYSQLYCLTDHYAVSGGH